MTDPISDMLTRIRNAYAARKPEVLIPYSNFKHNLAKILLSEGWIKNIDVKGEALQKQLLIQLKYLDSGAPALIGIKRVSKPGQRIYKKTREIPRVLGGFGITIVSTPKGLMTDRGARKQKVGGEIICQIW